MERKKEFDGRIGMLPWEVRPVSVLVALKGYNKAVYTHVLSYPCPIAVLDV
jgi:hypothetical protein